MNCNEAIPLLSPFHDGELPPARRQAVAEHIASCSACLLRVQSLRELSNLVERTPSPAAPDSLLSNVERALGGAKPAEGSRRRIQSPRTLALIVTATAAAVVGGLIVWQLACGPSVSHREMVRVFGKFIESYELGQSSAVDLLALTYDGTLVNEAEAATALRRESVARQTVLVEHEVAKRYLLKMPCCDCVQTIYSRGGKTSFVVFEHEQEELEWFDSRPMIHVECRGKPCCLVQLKDCLAASWRGDGGFVTVVGIRDVTQLNRLVDELRDP